MNVLDIDSFVRMAEMLFSKGFPFFPVRAGAQGSLCVRFPSFRGWSSKDSADFRSTKIVIRMPFLAKISLKSQKSVLKKMTLR